MAGLGRCSRRPARHLSHRAGKRAHVFPGASTREAPLRQPVPRPQGKGELRPAASRVRVGLAAAVGVPEGSSVRVSVARACAGAAAGAAVAARAQGNKTTGVVGCPSSPTGTNLRAGGETQEQSTRPVASRSPGRTSRCGTALSDSRERIGQGHAFRRVHKRAASPRTLLTEQGALLGVCPASLALATMEHDVSSSCARDCASEDTCHVDGAEYRRTRDECAKLREETEREVQEMRQEFEAEVAAFQSTLANHQVCALADLRCCAFEEPFAGRVTGPPYLALVLMTGLIC
eukprot:scaffold347_cov380-Prasinococcus_capsulatus_cf.AAC.38